MPKMLMIECGKDCLLENKCGNKRYVSKRAFMSSVLEKGLGLEGVKGCGDKSANKIR